MSFQSSLVAAIILALLLCTSRVTAQSVQSQKWNPASVFSGGLYFGFDLGGALVQGEKGVEVEPTMVIVGFGHVLTGEERKKVLDDWVRTDIGSGMAAGMRIGYSFLGYADVETYIFGHGNNQSGGGNWEGAGHWGFLLRVHPLQIVSAFKGKFADAMKTRFYDVNIYGGGGPITYMGYYTSSKYTGKPKGRGFKGYNYIAGLGIEFAIGKGASAGIDFRFIFPRYTTYIIDWGDDERDVKSIPSTVVFAPVGTVTFHFGQ